MSASIGDTVRSVIEAGGYPALVVLIFAENIFPPIPSELVLPLAGFYVGQGELAFLPAVAFATAGSLAGALLLYALGRYGGRRLVSRYGLFLRVTEERLERAEEWFDRRGGAVVFLGRLVPGARSIVSIPAGMAEMSLWRFTLLTTLGSAAWNSILIGAGWALGANWEEVNQAVGSVSNAVLALFGLALVGGTTAWIVHRRRARRAGASDEQDGDSSDRG